MRRALCGMVAASIMTIAGAAAGADPAPVAKEPELNLAPPPVSPPTISEVVTPPSDAVVAPRRPGKPLPPPPITYKAGITPIVVNGTLVYDYETDRFQKENKIPRGPVRMWWDYVRSPQHQCEPDGCYAPVGNCSFWTEWKYTYGSSRQFFGSAESAPVHRQFFDPELPPGYMLRAWQPRKYGYVE